MKFHRTAPLLWALGLWLGVSCQSPKEPSPAADSSVGGESYRLQPQNSQLLLKVVRLNGQMVEIPLGLKEGVIQTEHGLPVAGSILALPSYTQQGDTLLTNRLLKNCRKSGLDQPYAFFELSDINPYLRPINTDTLAEQPRFTLTVRLSLGDSTQSLEIPVYYTQAGKTLRMRGQMNLERKKFPLLIESDSLAEKQWNPYANLVLDWQAQR